MKYDQEVVRQFLADEQRRAADEKHKSDEEVLNKLRSSTEKAATGSQLAFEQTQANRFEIDRLRSEIKRCRWISLIAILLSLVCISMTMLEELEQMASLLP